MVIITTVQLNRIKGHSASTSGIRQLQNELMIHISKVSEEVLQAFTVARRMSEEEVGINSN